MSNYLHATPENGRQLMMRELQGLVVMLNLLNFRTIADYSASPELDPGRQISGEQAYSLYMEAVKPILTKSGAEGRRENNLRLLVALFRPIFHQKLFP